MHAQHTGWSWERQPRPPPTGPVRTTVFFKFSLGVSTWLAPAGLSAIRPVAAQPHTRGQAAPGHPKPPGWHHSHTTTPTSSVSGPSWRLGGGDLGRPPRPVVSGPGSQRPTVAAVRGGAAAATAWVGGGAGGGRGGGGGRATDRRPRPVPLRPMRSCGVWGCVCVWRGACPDPIVSPPAHTRCEWGLIGLVCGRRRHGSRPHTTASRIAHGPPMAVGAFTAPRPRRAPHLPSRRSTAWRAAKGRGRQYHFHRRL